MNCGESVSQNIECLRFLLRQKQGYNRYTDMVQSKAHQKTVSIYMSYRIKVHN